MIYAILKLNKGVSMKNFKLKENEEILKIAENILVKANENNFTLTMFLTNKRLILFKDINNELEYNAFLKARNVAIPANNEVVFDIDLTEIKEFSYQDDVNYITFKDNNTLKLYCSNFTNYLK